MQYQSLKFFIKNIRSARAAAQLRKGSALSGIISLLIIVFFGWLEYIFHFSADSRYRIAAVISASGITIFGYLILKWIIQKKGLIGNFSLYETAEWIGQKRSEISDRLLNCLQLENQLKDNPENSDLINRAVDKTLQQTVNLKSDQLIPAMGIKLKIGLIVSFLVIGFSWFYYSEKPQNAYIRLFNPTINYPVPLPFSLYSMIGNQDILSGDTIQIAITGMGDLPDSIDMVIQAENSTEKIPVLNAKSTFTHVLNKISSNLIIWGEVHSSSLFSPWEIITSIPDTITVIGRPRIDNIEFIVIPPSYTHDPHREHLGSVTNIRVLRGSKINIKASASKPLSKAWTQFGKRKKSLKTSISGIFGNLSIMESDTLTMHCQDENGISNLDPTHYFVSVYDDRAPEIAVFDPGDRTELDENMEIPFSFQVNDDYGVSDISIEFRIIHPSYLSPDTIHYIQPITHFISNLTSQNIHYDWNLDKLGLMPEDELHFRIAVSDNNSITGPSKTQSKEFSAFYPSLEDLFMNVEEQENEIVEDAEELTLTLDEVQEMLEDLELDLLKSEEMNWEHSQKAEESLQKIEDIFQQIEEMSETMEKIREQVDKNNLVNEELSEKFSDLQKLLDQLMTPEMREAIQKLQEAMEQMDPEKMLEAMEDLEFNIEDFEQQLDRFIDMFEMALAEQKMDEIQKQLEQMIREQTDILEETENQDTKTEDLAAREKRQEEELKNLEDSMKQAEEMMQNLSSQTAESLKEIRTGQMMENAEENLASSQKQFALGEMEQGGENAESAKKNLQEIQNQFAQAQQAFQDQMVGEMTKEFQRVIHNILTISQSQEELHASAKSLKSSSPNLTETAVVQNNIRRQMAKLMDQLLELSTKTFYITPDIGKMVGRSILSMDKSIAMLEQKQVSSGRNEQKRAMEGLNDAAFILLDAMEQMASSGSASGLEAFMQQMEQLSQKQQGINQGTMQLGQMSLMAQRGMMQKLGQQQSMLQQALQELLSENPGQKEGGAAKAAEEMEEVIKNFKNRNVNKRTIERQERILSRMLDSHKSLTPRDYSKKRKSKTGEEFLYLGPDGLPYDLGERKLLLMEAMETALKEGYSQEYNKMIKNYFQNLQDELIDEPVEP